MSITAHPSGENTCPPPAANTSGESLAARAAGGQGVGILPTAADPVYGRAASFLMCELEEPFGFWTLCCDFEFAGRLIPSPAVREARRA